MIDTHVHALSPDLDRYPLRPTPPDLDWYHDPRAAGTPATLLEQFTRAGVEGAVFIQAFSAYGADNRYAVDAANSDPRRLRSVVLISATEFDPTTKLAAWVDAGASGLRVICSKASDSLAFDQAVPVIDHPVSRALIRRAHELKIAIVLTMPKLLQTDAAKLVSLLEENPELHFVIDHGGFPSIDNLCEGPPYPNATDLFSFARYPGAHVKVTTIPLDTARAIDVEEPRRFVDELARHFGPERLMWGSNWPTSPLWSSQPNRTYEELVELGRFAFSSFDARERDASLDTVPRGIFGFGASNE